MVPYTLSLFMDRLQSFLHLSLYYLACILLLTLNQGAHNSLQKVDLVAVEAGSRLSRTRMRGELKDCYTNEP